VLKRGELPLTVGALLGAVILGGLVMASPRDFWFLAFFAAGLTLHVAHWTADWWKLRRADALAYFHQEQAEERREATAIVEHQTRLAMSMPIASWCLVAGITVVSMVQVAVPGIQRSVAVAALVKDAARAGEWWRLLTASYLHGNLAHLVGNMSALFALGAVIEAYDRRLRVPLVYLAGVLGGSLCSAVFVRASGLGASAGVLALLAYLLVLMHRRGGDTSRWLRGHFLRMLAVTALAGLAGFLVIDNAAHLGGILAGMLVGVVVVPHAGDAQTQSRQQSLDIVGWMATAVLAGGAAFTIAQLLRARP
jgi:rhomboid protease GluP